MTKTKKGKSSTTKVDTKRRKINKEERLTEQVENIKLFADVNNEEISTQDLAKEWIKLCLDDHQVEAVYQLLALISKAAGSSTVVTKEAIQQEVKIITVLEELQDSIKDEENPNFPFGNKSKEGKKFKKRFLEFFKYLFKLGLYDIFENDVILNILNNWLIGMSNSTYRPFRLISTSLSLNIIGFISEGCAEIEAAKNIAIKQSTKNKKGANVKQNLEKQKQADKHLNCLHDTLKILFKKIYEHRFRDVDTTIRADCAKEIANWTLKYPNYFLNSEHLRYFGWLLSDKASSVRNEALIGIAKLFKKDSLSSLLQQFITSCKSRLLEMALKEVDTTTKCHAINVMFKIHQRGLLDDEENEQMINLLFHNDVKVQKAIAPFIQFVIYDEMIDDKCLEWLETRRQDLKEDEVTKVAVKCFLQILSNSSIDFQYHYDNNVVDVIDAFPNLSKNYNAFNPIAAPVNALLEYLDFFKNWKVMLELAAQETTRSRKKQVKLEEKEELILLKVIEVVFKDLVKKDANVKALEDKSNKKPDEPTQLFLLRNYLIKEARPYSALLKKYSAYEQPIVSVLKMIELSLNGEMFLEANKMKSYEELLSGLNRIFLNHSQHIVLYQSTLTIKSLSQFQATPPQEFEMFFNGLFEDIIKALLNPKEGPEAVLIELQRIRVLLLSLDKSLGFIYFNGSPIIDVLNQYIDEGIYDHSEVNIKKMIASFDIKYHIYLWLCKSTNEKDSVDNENENEIIEYRTRLLRSLQSLIEYSIDNDNKSFYHAQGFAFVMINNIVWLDTQSKILLNKVLVPSKLTLEDICMKFANKTLKKWDLELLSQFNNGLEENEHPFILKDSQVRNTYTKIITTMIRSVLLNVFNLPTLKTICNNYGTMDPVVDESVKILFNQSIKEKLKNAVNVGNVQFIIKFMEECIFESYEKSWDNEDRFESTLSLAKLIAITLRNVNKHNALISKCVARLHQRFLREITKHLEENKDLAKTLNTFRIINLILKGLLAPIHAKEILKQTTEAIQQYKPDDTAQAWSHYFTYIKNLEDACPIQTTMEPILQDVSQLLPHKESTVDTQNVLGPIDEES